MALEMQKMCMTLTAPDGSPVVMRIGLHCGPLLAGVVGGNMLRYQLFGAAMDAVTQLEQACRLGGVRLSKNFATILRPSDPRWRSDGNFVAANADSSTPLGRRMSEDDPELGSASRGSSARFAARASSSFVIPGSRRLRGSRSGSHDASSILEARKGSFDVTGSRGIPVLGARKASLNLTRSRAGSIRGAQKASLAAVSLGLGRRSKASLEASADAVFDFDVAEVMVLAGASALARPRLVDRHAQRCRINP